MVQKLGEEEDKQIKKDKKKSKKKGKEDPQPEKIKTKAKLEQPAKVTVSKKDVDKPVQKVATVAKKELGDEAKNKQVVGEIKQTSGSNKPSEKLKGIEQVKAGLIKKLDSVKSEPKLTVQEKSEPKLIVKEQPIQQTAAQKPDIKVTPP